MSTTVIIDTRELGAPYIDFLRQHQDIDVRLQPLTSGDILVNGLAIERKTAEDFFLTLREGRLFPQLLKLKHTYARHLLLIEGKGMRYHLDQEPLYGLYLRLAAGWQLPVLHTRNGEQTATCIVRICHQDTVAPPGPIRARPRNPAYEFESVAMRILMEIPEIGASNAQSLLTRFSTLDRIFAADVIELVKIEGIGKKRAEAIVAANSPPSRSQTTQHSQPSGRVG